MRGLRSIFSGRRGRGRPASSADLSAGLEELTDQWAQRLNRDRPVSCGYYLRQRHRLIRRHLETVTFNPDFSARWQLKVDFELPSDPEARWIDDDGEPVFLFPLAFLKKSDPRTGFEVRDESGSVVDIPIRSECDVISGLAAAHAAQALLEPKRPRSEPPLVAIDSPEDLEEILRQIASDKPFGSSLRLQKLLTQIGLGYGADTKKQNVAVGRSWFQSGLLETLHMLVDHSLIWVPLRGKPGERRSIVLAQEIAPVRRVFFRWIFGDIRMPKPMLRHPFKAWFAWRAKPDDYLTVGEKKYGRRTIRISFSALGERIGQPLGWMPFEFEFPTVYTKRCASYHFEVRCPPGRSPRDLRPARGTPLAHTSVAHQFDERHGRTTFTSRIARHDRPGNRFPNDVWFRVTVGVGDGAFPVLWFLGGAITALMLWIYADYKPHHGVQIAAAILLVVPALSVALAYGDSEIPVTRTIGGARILLLITGLSTVVAASILIEAEPIGMSERWSWAACAMAATAATIPLGTGWLLSVPFVWRQLKRLKSGRLQKYALWISVALALIGVVVLTRCGEDDPIARGIVAVYLLLIAVGMTVLANNRAAIPIGRSRRYIAVCFLLAGLTCLALACVELKGAVDNASGLQTTAERVAAVTLIASLFAGRMLSWVTSPFSPDSDEIHVSPTVGHTLVAEESVRELTILMQQEGRNEDGKQDSAAPHSPSSL